METCEPCGPWPRCVFWTEHKKTSASTVPRYYWSHVKVCHCFTFYELLCSYVFLSRDATLALCKCGLSLLVHMVADMRRLNDHGYTCVYFIIRCLMRHLFLLLLKVLDEQKLQQVDSLWKEFETPEKANKMWVTHISFVLKVNHEQS